MKVEMEMKGCVSLSLRCFFLILEKVLAARAAFNHKCQNFTGGLGRH
jgi:hypothetical protein